MARLIRVENCDECPRFQRGYSTRSLDEFAFCSEQEGPYRVDSRGLGINPGCPLPEETTNEQ